MLTRNCKSSNSSHGNHLAVDSDASRASESISPDKFETCRIATKGRSRRSIAGTAAEPDRGGCFDEKSFLRPREAESRVPSNDT